MQRGKNKTKKINTTRREYLADDRLTVFQESVNRAWTEYQRKEKRSMIYLIIAIAVLLIGVIVNFFIFYTGKADSVYRTLISINFATAFTTFISLHIYAKKEANKHCNDFNNEKDILGQLDMMYKSDIEPKTITQYMSTLFKRKTAVNVNPNDNLISSTKNIIPLFNRKRNGHANDHLDTTA